MAGPQLSVTLSPGPMAGPPSIPTWPTAPHPQRGSELGLGVVHAVDGDAVQALQGTPGLEDQPWPGGWGGMCVCFPQSPTLTSSVCSCAAWLEKSRGDCWHSWQTWEICEDRHMAATSQGLAEHSPSTHADGPKQDPSPPPGPHPAPHRPVWLHTTHMHTSCSAVALWPVTSRHMMMCSKRMTWKDDRIGLQSSTVERRGGSELRKGGS